MWNLEKMVQMNLFAKKKKREEKKRTNLQIPTEEGVDEMGLTYIRCYV